MAEVPVQDMMKRVGSVFKLVLVASQRTVQLIEGAKPLVETKKNMKLGTIALLEIAEGKLEFGMQE